MGQGVGGPHLGAASRETPEPPAQRKPKDAEDEMTMVVEELCPQYRELRDDPLQDSIRDMVGAAQPGGERLNRPSGLGCRTAQTTSSERSGRLASTISRQP